MIGLLKKLLRRRRPSTTAQPAEKVLTPADQSEAGGLEDMDLQALASSLEYGPRVDKIVGGSGRFGFDASNPIPVQDQTGQLKYLSRLQCPCGEPFLFHRLGSCGQCPDGHVIDRYELICREGEHQCILYLDMYHRGQSGLLPEGLTFGTEDGLGFPVFVPDFPEGIEMFISELNEQRGTAPSGANIVLDQRLLERDRSVQLAWSVYAVAKAAWQTNDPEYFSQRPELKRSASPFDEELHAREALVQIWSEQAADDPYLDLLAEIHDRGMLPEYVHCFLAQPGWPEPPGLNLSRLADWLKLRELKDHQAETMAWLE